MGEINWEMAVFCLGTTLRLASAATRSDMHLVTVRASFRAFLVPVFPASFVHHSQVQCVLCPAGFRDCSIRKVFVTRTHSHVGRCRKLLRTFQRRDGVAIYPYALTRSS